MGRKIEDLEGCLDEEEDRWLKGELDVLASECSVRKAALEKERDKRKDLRARMKHEKFDAKVSVRVEPTTEKVLERYSELEGIGKTALLRESFHEGIQKREKFNALSAWLESWEEELDRLSEGDKGGERLRDEVEILIERIRERRVAGR
jgi:hypothetical protein